MWSRKLDRRPGKRIDADRYMPLRGLASQGAASLAKRHEQNQTIFPSDDPSSTAGTLVGCAFDGRSSL
ncbi:hypothetical protein Skr01_71800 [Sphaerisporangium krabiense]|nr:hypothetical protein Skr01_71800 [Sphaerisporangium krabiense]